MANSQNPDNSAIIQVLLDLEAAGFKSNVDPVITKLKSDKKLSKDLEARFLARSYANDKVKYTQLTIDQHLMELTDPALRILTFLGMYCSQEGMVSVKLDTLAKAAKQSLNTTRKAISELKKRGLLAERDGAKRHEPALWQVHPGVIHSGKRFAVRRQADDFVNSTSSCQGKDYLLQQKLPLVIQQDSVCRIMPDGSKVYYIRLDLVSADTEREPFDSATVSKGPSKIKQDNFSKSTSFRQADPQIPGQMEITDLPDFMPDPVNDDNLPF